MASLLNLLALSALALPLTSAHFIVNAPAALGFNSQLQGTAPCGGFSFVANGASDYHVDGEAIALQTLHAQSNIIYRATLDRTWASNWTVLFPIVTEYGLGNFCEPSIPVPASWVGQTGTLQVVQHAEDGLLYQCSVVKFVAGKVATLPSTCTNSTGVSASFNSDSELSQLSGGSPATTTVAGTVASSTAPAATAATTTKASGASLTASGLWLGVICAAGAVASLMI